MLAAWLKLFRQKYIYIRIRTSRDVETWIVERPGLWMEANALSKLRRELVEVAGKTLPKSGLTYGIFSSDKDALDHAIITMVYRKSDNRPIAFNALSLMELELGGKPLEVLHMGLVMIDPQERNRGLSWVLYGLTCILLYMRNRMRPLWISNVTQVPAVVGMVSETFSQVYPGPHAGARRSLTHTLLARQIMANRRHVFGVGKEAKFNEDRFIITNAYTGGSDELKKTFADTTKHRQDVYNSFCKQELNYKRGDDVLQLGMIDMSAARNYLINSVPRRSLSGLLVTLASAFLQRLVLPVSYWADSSQQWNILRPAKNGKS